MKLSSLSLFAIVSCVCYASDQPARLDNNMNINDILTKLNTWNRNELKNYEKSLVVERQEPLPTNQTVIHVGECIHQINELCHTVSWDPLRLLYLATPVTSKITKDTHVLRILTKMNSWRDKDDIRLYEFSRSGKPFLDILPSDQVTRFMTQHQDDLNKIGYKAVWDWNKSLYDVEKAKPKEGKLQGKPDEVGSKPKANRKANRRGR